MGIFDSKLSKFRQKFLFNVDSAPCLGVSDSISETSNARLSGWVCDPKERVSLSLELNGSLIYEPLIEYPRLDVVGRIPFVSKNPICGFAFDIPLNLLAGIGKNELALIAKTQSQRVVLWQWNATGVEEVRAQSKDALRAYFACRVRSYKSVKAQDALSEIENNTPVRVHAVFEVSYSLLSHSQEALRKLFTITETAPDSSSDADKYGKYFTIASFTILVPDETRVDAATTMLKNAKLPSSVMTRVFSRQSVHGWQAIINGDNASTSGFRDVVLYVREGSNLSYCHLPKLIKDYIELGSPTVFMPALYGDGGLHAPLGVHLSQIRARSSIKGENIPALCPVSCCGSVWLSSALFLNALDYQTHGVQSDSCRITFPPKDKFHYYTDLRQPMLFSKVADNCGNVPSQEIAALQHALEAHVLFSPKPHTTSAKVVFVIGESWNPRSEQYGWQYQVLKLIKDLDAQNYDVQIVSDTPSGNWYYIGGYSVVPFEDYVNTQVSQQNGWVIACGWDAMRAAQSIRYLYGLSVGFFAQSIEIDSFNVFERDNLDNVKLAYCADYVPIVNSDWLKIELSTIATGGKEILDIAPAVNEAVFRQVEAPRIARSVVCDVATYKKWPKVVQDEFILACKELRACGTRVSAVNVPSSRLCKERLVDAFDFAYEVLESVEYAYVLSCHEICVCVYPSPSTPFTAYEAMACGTVPILCAGISSDDTSALVDTMLVESALSCNLSNLSTELPALIKKFFDEDLDAKNARIEAIKACGAKYRVNSVATSCASLLVSLDAKKLEMQTRLAEQRSSRRDVTVIIPVYNALDATVMCLRSVLAKMPKNWNLIVVNDCSDASTTQWLEQWFERCKEISEAVNQIKLINLPKNVGFVQACLAGFNACETSHDVVLLNSDVVLTSKVLNRLQDAAYSRYNVGLASALSSNSPHLQVDMNPGDSLEDTAKAIYELVEPKHPTIITPEGQLLYMRRWALDSFGFFDKVYNRGFCEESDMCLRMFLSGVDMVCADNAYIHHRKSASFGNDARIEFISENRPIFNTRWGRYYIPIYSEFLSRNVIEHVRNAYAKRQCNLDSPVTALLPKDIDSFFGDTHKRVRTTTILKDTEVVFILPSVVLGGGTLSVLQHVDELLMRGVRARVISISKTDIVDQPYLSPAMTMSWEQVLELDWTKQKVIATFWTTAYVLRALKKRFPSIDAYYYIQDYEPWFYSRPEDFTSSEKAAKTYEFGFKGVAKTQFLANIIKEKHGVDIKVITPGVAEHIFYPGEQDKYDGRPRLSALFRPQTARRGSKELLAMLVALKKRVPELKVNLFGQGDSLPEELSEFVSLHGKLSPMQVAKLYRASDIIVDMSYWHGFGRMGIEGMMCGAVPVLSKSGGIYRYAEDGLNSFLVDSDDIDTAVDRVVLLAKDRDLRLKMRENALRTTLEFSETSAVDDWMRIWGTARS